MQKWGGILLWGPRPQNIAIVYLCLDWVLLFFGDHPVGCRAQGVRSSCSGFRVYGVLGFEA